MAATANDGGLRLVSLQTGTTLCAFKGAGCVGRSGVARVGRDFVLVSAGNKALIQSFQLGKVFPCCIFVLPNTDDCVILRRPQEQPHQRSIPPERILSLSSTSDGLLLIGGGDSGNLYVWEVGVAISAFVPYP